MDVPGRAGEMIARVERAWRDADLPADARAALAERAGEVMTLRREEFDDEHHPAFLHPLRTILLLLEIGETDPRAHAAALAPDSAELLELVRYDDERLERLLLAEAWLRRSWLAGRLDRIRHLHLWAGPDATREALERADAEEAPLAYREGGRLARAWADWMEKARRHRLVERAETRPPAAGSAGSTDR